MFLETIPARLHVGSISYSEENIAEVTINMLRDVIRRPTDKR